MPQRSRVVDENGLVVLARNFRMDRLVLLSATLALLVSTVVSAPYEDHDWNRHHHHDHHNHDHYHANQFAADGLPAKELTPKNEDKPIVNLRSGKVQGLWLKSRKGRPIAAFTNIPYARPPTGEYRFKAPHPVEPWEGVHASIPLSKIPLCPVKNKIVHYIDEDCLKINVYTPSLNSTVIDSGRKLPVLVWISDFREDKGFSVYRPEYFLDEDVILVTFNFRVGILGFLSTGDKEALGNWGLKDQAFALKWVKENIEVFGGDSQLVTIFGDADSLMHIAFHMGSPLSKGLFHRSIIQSVATDDRVPPGIKPSTDAEDVVHISNNLECDNSSSTELLRCLRSKPVDFLLDRHSEKYFREVIESLTYNHSTEDMPIFLGQDILQGTVSLLANDVPVLAGINSADSFHETHQLYQSLKKAIEEADTCECGGKIKIDLGASVNLNEFHSSKDADGEELIRKVFEFYSLFSKNLTIQAVNSVITDGRIVELNRFRKAHGNQSMNNSPVYLYYFNYRGKYSRLDALAKHPHDPEYLQGAARYDNLIYLFPKQDGARRQIALRGRDLMVSQLLISLWTNFAATGNPTPKDAGFSNIWLPAGKDELFNYLEISPGGLMVSGNGLRKEALRFWKDLHLAELRFTYPN